MIYKVLTDTWKADLSQGDTIEDQYSTEVMKRAVESGYVELLEAPTMENTKEEIQDYLQGQEIEFSQNMTKAELLELIQ